MKAFFGKIWSWALAHKAIAITLAVVLVAGVTCAIVLPIALHEHSFATEWSADATNHWHAASCRHTEATSDLAAHTYDNACDTACNVCAATRAITHNYATTLTKGESTHYYACLVCGDKKDEAAHAFNQSVAHSEYLKTAATATTKAVYYKSCVCGKAGTETFETDKIAVAVEITAAGNKTYDGVAVGAPTYTVTDDLQGVEILYKVKEADDATYTTDAPVNVGVYTVKVNVPESATHAGASATAELTISKGAAEITDIDVTTTGKTYDGNPVNAPEFAANFRNGATVEYKVKDADDSTYTTDVPVNAGNYTVRVSIPETANYTGDVMTADFTIAKATATIESITIDDDITYGTPIAPMANTDVNYTGEFLYEYKASGADDSTYDTVLPQAVGQYVVRATLLDTDNYNAVSYVQSFQIVPAAITGLNLTATYNGMSNFSVCLGEEYDDLWIMVTIDSNSIDVGTNKTVTGVSVDTLNSNYTVEVAGIESFKVLPAELTIEWSLPASSAYDGSAKEATAMIVDGVIAGEDVQIQVTLATADNVNPGPVRYEATLTGTHAGNYKMDIPFVDFTIYECEHNTLDQGGSCSVCGEFRGIEIDATGGNDVTLTTGLNYFRFASVDYSEYNYATYKISFVDYDAGSGGAKLYARSGDTYAEQNSNVFSTSIELWTSTDDYYYLVIEANENMEISIIVEQSENA